MMNSCGWLRYWPDSEGMRDSRDFNSPQVSLRSGLCATHLGKWFLFYSVCYPTWTVGYLLWISSPHSGFLDISWQLNANRRVVSGVCVCFLYARRLQQKPKGFELCWMDRLLAEEAMLVFWQWQTLLFVLFGKRCFQKSCCIIFGKIKWDLFNFLTVSSRQQWDEDFSSFSDAARKKIP